MGTNKYARLSNGEIIMTERIEQKTDLQVIKYYDTITDLLEKGDMVKIAFYSPRYSKRVIRFFEVESIMWNGALINLESAHMNLQICDGQFTNNEFEPMVLSVVTREKLKSIEYNIDEMEQLLSSPSKQISKH